MITAQDIREKTFEKATFGGYAMNEVDDFLDEMANDIAVSQKELATMRSKMKVLVEKIEEYRGSEEDMHKALVSAQKTARTIEEEAQAKADALIAEAQEKADAILAEAQEKADALTGNLVALRQAEELRLQKAQSAAAEGVQTSTKALADALAYIRAIADADLVGAIVTPAPGERKAIAAPAQEPEAAAEEPLPEEEPEAEVEEEPEAEVEQEPAAEEELPEEEPEEPVVEAEPEIVEEPEAAEEPLEEDVPAVDPFTVDVPVASREEEKAPVFDVPARQPRRKGGKAPNATGEPDYFKAFEDAVFRVEQDEDDTIPSADDGDDAPMFRL